MTLQGSFNTGVQAMIAQTQSLNNISTNIANVSTNGYKTQVTSFQTLLNEVSGANQSNFFAVKTTDSRLVDTQGTVATTGRTLDLALNGRGFMVTNPQLDGTGQWGYTRDGSLSGKTVTIPGSDLNGDGTDDMQNTYLTTADGSYVYGWPADASGNFSTSNSLATLQPVMYSSTIGSPGETPINLIPGSIPANPTTTIGLQANLSAASGGRQPVGLPFVDQDGATRTLTVGFTPDLSTNTWQLDMASVDPSNASVPVAFDPPTINFGPDGKILSPSDGLVNVEISDSTGPQTITLDLSKVSQFSDGNKLTVENITQDGYIAGSLNTTYFNGNGVLIGSYTNGQVKNLFKLPVATFPADNNLEAKPGNIFVETADSGVPVLSALGSPNGTTQFVPGALETSNVDLADQFSKMIVTQRAYSSAAKVIRTVDEMTQAVRDLKT